MASPGWTYTESPFHAGERAIQARLGVQERMDKQGRRVIRNYLPEQHRQFYSQLPYVLVGTVDDRNRPWASILVGEPGFLASPDEHTLSVTTKVLPGDPLAANLAENIDIGLLGIELHTRRRNRLNGTVFDIHPDGFQIKVGQSFGNCPQYIQARRFEFHETLAKPSVQAFTGLGTVAQALVTTADTLFIATAYQEDSAGAARGVDVSHRGGKPGFVRIDDEQTLTIPDFSGNNHFNTFGNLELNPGAGLLFIDFEQGHLVYLTGTAEVIWDGPEIREYAGAERLLRFHLEQGHWVEGSFPLRWSSPELSPFLEQTGPW